VAKGNCKKPGTYSLPMRPLAEIRADFEQTAWPVLKGQNPYSLALRRPALFAGNSYLKQAIRIALWDLMAQLADLPLYQFLGAPPENNRVRAYGSGLDYPLTENEALAVFRSFIARGFTAIKVKVGDPDPRRDVRRLQAVRQAVGEDVEIAIDANQGWTWEVAVERIRLYQKEGIRLSYLEDPLPHEDIEGLVRLSAAIDLDVAGHDYFEDPAEVRQFVSRKAIKRIRVLGDINYALACAEIATEFNVPMIFGNSLFELGVHAAVALPFVDRLEFSDLGLNLLPKSPIRFENGYAIAPDQPGIGLEPDPQKLERFGCS
jgi:L-alanine-DL-glutamate epimerase-like enolase superfamily enzyme